MLNLSLAYNIMAAALASQSDDRYYLLKVIHTQDASNRCDLDKYMELRYDSYLLSNLIDITMWYILWSRDGHSCKEGTKHYWHSPLRLFIFYCLVMEIYLSSEHILQQNYSEGSQTFFSKKTFEGSHFFVKIYNIKPKKDNNCVNTMFDRIWKRHVSSTGYCLLCKHFTIFSIWAYLCCNNFTIWDFFSDRFLCKINICCCKIFTVEWWQWK